MPITVRIAPHGEGCVEETDPEDEEHAKCGIADFAGWWPAKRPARHEGRREEEEKECNKAEYNCGEDETDGPLHEEASELVAG
jgi:hypothetical protein